MKNFFIMPIIIGCMILSACADQETDLLFDSAEGAELLAANEDAVLITEDVSSDEVNSILNMLFPANKGRSQNYNYSIICDSTGKECIICVNYQDDGGFALISATKTYKPVIAYNSRGNFDEKASDMPVPLKKWLKMTISDISGSSGLPVDSLAVVADEWHHFEAATVSRGDGWNYDYDHSYLRRLSQQQVDYLTSLAQDSLDSWRKNGYRVYKVDDHPGVRDFPDMPSMCNFLMGISYPDYAEDYWAISYVVEKDKTYHKGDRHCLKTVWNQGNGYNQVFDIKSDNPYERIPVGCGPLAVGQIMYYFEYPSTYSWKSMTLSGYGNQMTSSFLYDVYKRCNASYIPGLGTSCSSDGIKNALNSYGYTYNYLNASKVNYSVLMYDTPVLMLSYFDNNKNYGHAWIVEGANQRRETTEVEIYTFTQADRFEMVYYEENQNLILTNYYVNWGWGGMYDGYYPLNNMIPDGYSSNTWTNAFARIKPNR